MATLYSTQLTNDRATPPVINSVGSGLYRIPWSHTIVTTPIVENDVLQMCKVPAGCKVILPLSLLHISGTTTAGTLNIGHAAYKDKNGDTVAAVADALVSDYDSTVITPTYLGPYVPNATGGAATAPLGTSVDALGVMDFTDAVQDIIIQCTAVNASFDGDVGDVWQGWFVVEYGGN